MVERPGKDSQAEILRRLTDLEAKAELATLMNLYCRTADTKDWDGWGRCFSEDAVYAGPFGEIKGRAEIQQVGRSRHENNLLLQHSITNMEFDVHGDEATGTASLLFFGTRSSDDLAQHADRGGHYTLEFRRAEGQWRIVRNELVIVWANGEQG